MCLWLCWYKQYKMRIEKDYNINKFDIPKEYNINSFSPSKVDLQIEWKVQQKKESEVRLFRSNDLVSILWRGNVDWLGIFFYCYILIHHYTYKCTEGVGFATDHWFLRNVKMSCQFWRLEEFRQRVQQRKGSARSVGNLIEVWFTNISRWLKRS